MCILEKITGLHVTSKDKFDISVSLVTLADGIWFIGDMYYNVWHWHHYIVAGLLSLGTVLSITLLYHMVKRHHLNWVKKRADRRDNHYVPYSRQSDN